MKTYETLEGKFVTENPGLENTIFGRDINGTPVVLNSILYRNSSPSYISMNRITPNNWSWCNYELRSGAIVVSEREAVRLSKIPNRVCYGQWRK